MLCSLGGAQEMAPAPYMGLKTPTCAQGWVRVMSWPAKTGALPTRTEAASTAVFAWGPTTHEEPVGIVGDAADPSLPACSCRLCRLMSIPTVFRGDGPPPEVRQPAQGHNITPTAQEKATPSDVVQVHPLLKL